MATMGLCSLMGKLDLARPTQSMDQVSKHFKLIFLKNVNWSFEIAFAIDSWAERGIIPRVMTYIFDKIDERKKEYAYTVYASYMEIYNEKAYDLLNEDHLVSPLDQWNKIEFKRDNLGNIHLSNISLHEIDDAKPGIDLLMMGNYIRKQAATPMNQCSSRSHCIFTLTFEGMNMMFRFI